jgi:hypothetical protein
MEWFVQRFFLSAGCKKKGGQSRPLGFCHSPQSKKLLAKYSSTPNREKNGVGMHSNLVFKKTKTGGCLIENLWRKEHIIFLP